MYRTIQGRAETELVSMNGRQADVAFDNFLPIKRMQQVNTCQHIQIRSCYIFVSKQ